MASVSKIGIHPISSCDPFVKVASGSPSLTGSPFTNLTRVQIANFYNRIKSWEFSFSCTGRYEWEITDSSDTFVEYQYTEELFSASTTLDFSQAFNPNPFSMDGTEKQFACNFYGWENFNLYDMPYVSGDDTGYPTVFRAEDGTYGMEFLFGFRQEGFGGGFTNRSANQWGPFAGNKGGQVNLFIAPTEAYTDSTETTKIVDGFTSSTTVEVGEDTYIASLDFYSGAFFVVIDDNIPSDRPTTDSSVGTIPANLSNFEIIAVSNPLLKAIWWPYNPNDGDGPIYDSATGEILRPVGGG